MRKGKSTGPLSNGQRQRLLDSWGKRRKVMQAAEAFVLESWAEMQELEGTNSLSIPVEYMNLHRAVCEWKGWKVFGDYPIQEESK